MMFINRRNLFALAPTAFFYNDLVAQERRRQLVIIMSFAADDAEAKSFVNAAVERLDELGWRQGYNIDIRYMWAANTEDRMQNAKEVLRLSPDAILVGGTPVAAALASLNPQVPTVFAQVADPIQMRVVTSFAHPSGNMTGFSTFDIDIGQKWLQLLHDIRPTKSVAVLVDYANPSWSIYMDSIKKGAEYFNLDIVNISVTDRQTIESELSRFANGGGRSMIVLPAPATTNHQQTIIASAARLNIAAVYPYSYFVRGGGLLAFGVDLRNQYVRAAEYANLLLRGAKPHELPVQNPSKYQLTINTKAAADMNIVLSESLLIQADELISDVTR